MGLSFIDVYGFELWNVVNNYCQKSAEKRCVLATQMLEEQSFLMDY